jgi:hypothetical protein
MMLLLIKWTNVFYLVAQKTGFFDGCRHSARNDSIGSFSVEGTAYLAAASIRPPITAFEMNPALAAEG